MVMDFVSLPRSDRFVTGDDAMTSPAPRCDRHQINMASGCDDPCKGGCDWYNWCIKPSLHESPHQCDKGHVW